MRSTSKYLFIVSLLALSTLCPAQVLLNDTFADGDRTDTTLPNESAFWVGQPTKVTMGTGSLQYAVGTSSEKLWTYFTPNGSPASLSVGQQLKATINFSASGLYNTTTSKNFRLGLFNDPTNDQLWSDTNSDGGGDGRWTDSTGYAIQMTLSSGSTAGGIQVGKRVNQTSGSLLGTSGDYSWGTTGGKATNLTAGTLYTMILTLDYMAVDKMDVTFDFLQGSTVLASASLTDNGTLGGDPIWTKFDQLFFRPSKAEGAADVLTFSELKIELIPEPATMILLGLGSLISLRKRS